MTKCPKCGSDLTDSTGVAGACRKCGEANATVSIAVDSATHSHTASSPTVDVFHHWYGLLAMAERLYKDDEGGVSVIVAQTACEVVLERAISKGFKAKGVPELDGPITKMISSYSPRNDNTRRLYKELTGDAIANQSFWQAYRDMVQHRNNAVHSGTKISQADARNGLDAARKLVEHVEQHNELQG